MSKTNIGFSVAMGFVVVLVVVVLVLAACSPEVVQAGRDGPRPVELWDNGSHQSWRFVDSELGIVCYYASRSRTIGEISIDCLKLDDTQ